MSAAYLIHLANCSDGVLYVLGLLLLITPAVMIDRFWGLRRTILGGNRIVTRATGAATLGIGALRSLRA